MKKIKRLTIRVLRPILDFHHRITDFILQVEDKILYNFAYLFHLPVLNLIKIYSELGRNIEIVRYYSNVIKIHLNKNYPFSLKSLKILSLMILGLIIIGIILGIISIIYISYKLYCEITILHDFLIIMGLHLEIIFNYFIHKSSYNYNNNSQSGFLYQILSRLIFPIKHYFIDFNYYIDYYKDIQANENIKLDQLNIHFNTKSNITNLGGINNITPNINPINEPSSFLGLTRNDFKNFIVAAVSVVIGVAMLQVIRSWRSSDEGDDININEPPIINNMNENEAPKIDNTNENQDENDNNNDNNNDNKNLIDQSNKDKGKGKVVEVESSPISKIQEQASVLENVRSVKTSSQLEQEHRDREFAKSLVKEEAQEIGKPIDDKSIKEYQQAAIEQATAVKHFQEQAFKRHPYYDRTPGLKFIAPFDPNYAESSSAAQARRLENLGITHRSKIWQSNPIAFQFNSDSDSSSAISSSNSTSNSTSSSPLSSPYSSNPGSTSSSPSGSPSGSPYNSNPGSRSGSPSFSFPDLSLDSRSVSNLDSRSRSISLPDLGLRSPSASVSTPDTVSTSSSASVSTPNLVSTSSSTSVSNFNVDLGSGSGYRLGFNSRLGFPPKLGFGANSGIGSGIGYGSKYGLGCDPYFGAGVDLSSRLGSPSASVSTPDTVSTSSSTSVSTPDTVSTSSSASVSTPDTVSTFGLRSDLEAAFIMGSGFDGTVATPLLSQEQLEELINDSDYGFQVLGRTPQGKYVALLGQNLRTGYTFFALRELLPGEWDRYIESKNQPDNDND